MLLFLLRRPSSSRWSAGSGPALLAAVAGSLLLNYFFTPPLHTLHHRRDGERARAGWSSSWSRRWSARSSTSPPGAPGRRPGRRAEARDAGHPRRQRAARRGRAAGAAGAGPGDVRPRPRSRCWSAADDGWVGDRVAERRAGAVAPRPSEADAEVPVDDDLHPGAARTAARGRGPAAGRRVRRPGRGRAATSSRLRRGGRRGRAARRGRQDAHRAARRGQPRPAHAARRRSRRRSTSLRSPDVDLDADGPRRAAGDRRRVARPADRAGRQPARHEPAAGRRAVASCSRPSRSTRSCRAALDDLGAGRPTRRASTSPDDLPAVQADPGLLERVVANLVANALRLHARRTSRRCVTGSALGDRVELRVVDRGPGIPPDDRDRVFAPFQRLGDTDNTTGVGLGPGAVPRADRGDGRHARARGHPRRRAHHGRLPAGGHRHAAGRAERASATRRTR